MNEKTEESMKNLYKGFKKWIKNNYPNGKMPSNRLFSNILFSKEIKRHKDVEKVRINKKVTSGIRILAL